MKTRLKDRRLLACAGFARPGRRFADIGTDHAYLPIHLCSEGISPGGIASDINRGPLARAGAHVRAAGLEDRIVCGLFDGLTGIESFSPEDIYILGMGGELISEILGGNDYIRNPGIRLILQPMTHSYDLRKYLLKSGFAVKDECLVTDKPIDADASRIPPGIRIYQIICASYSPEDPKAGDNAAAGDREEKRVYDPELVAELMLGKKNIRSGSLLVKELAARYASGCEKAAAGLRAGGKDVTNELALLRVLNRISGK